LKVSFGPGRKTFEDFNEKNNMLCQTDLDGPNQQKKNNKKILQRIGLQLNLATLMLYFISWASEAAESGGGVDPHSPPLLEPSK
jgi:hypothetical protein